MKKKIAIVAGGNSGEREISLKSAAVVIKNLDAKKFEGFVIDIHYDAWIYVDKKNKKHPIDKNDFTIVLNNRKIKFDVIFMAIHGTPGEDGKLQGYFDMLQIPYTSCGQGTSALTLNKSFTNKVVSSFGVKTANSVHLFKRDNIDIKKITEKLIIPCFVKPNNGGSSVGMSKVKKTNELKSAITKAFKEDDEVLVEEFVKGIEITCGVFRSKGKLFVFPITEIVSKKDFFDYEAKYISGKCDEITPARISTKLEAECKATSCLIYTKLNCKGVVRIDYIASAKGLYFLEINTVPGMSEMSIIPQQANNMEIPIKNLFTMMIEEALEK